MLSNETFLVLGGGGMIGIQIVRQIARNLTPRKVVVASLHKREADDAIAQLRAEFPDVDFDGVWGDVFLRAEWNDPERPTPTRESLLASPEHRADLYVDLFGDVDAAYGRAQLVRLILDHRPDVIVDSINTATGISYQDIYAASVAARHDFDELAAAIRAGDKVRAELCCDHAEQSVHSLLIAQSVPQLIRHVVLTHRAMVEAGTRLYVKVGTTGTGGMGLNVPYTHSEDKPSVKLMSKTAVAFAHTGLMFLMARTLGGPVVKEVKPGAMVGYADITRRAVRERGKPVHIHSSREDALEGRLELVADPAGFEDLGPLEMVVVDTGENGIFTKGEFEAITHLRQMEFITPEEIAFQVLLEIRGSNTGYDVIAAIDSAVMNPTYRAGYLRHFALEEVRRLEREAGTHSVALGQLGPPEIGKLLWEAHLLELCYSTLAAVLDHSAESIAESVSCYLREHDDVRQIITSVGLPILTADGKALIRGPFIRIPEVPGETSAPVSAPDVDRWAAKGWVDLRPANFEKWRERFQRMLAEARRVRGHGSAAITRETYLTEEISIGAVAGWIFNNEEKAYRIK
jgi:NAD(P)-dependent dehydrogenase (short-subunit alcohol dehydrogenase family)